jgi:hypothetical protein
VFRDPARLPDEGVERVTVRRHDFLPRQHLVESIEVHQFIAGSRDGHHRSPVDIDFAVPETGQDAELRRGHRWSGGHHGRPVLVVLTTRSDVLLHVASVPDDHSLEAAIGILDSDHGIRAFRNRRPGHDPHGFTGAECPAGEPAGGDGFRHGKHDRPLNGGGGDVH